MSVEVGDSVANKYDSIIFDSKVIIKMYSKSKFEVLSKSEARRPNDARPNFQIVACSVKYSFIMSN